MIQGLSKISIGDLNQEIKIIGSHNDVRQPMPIIYRSVRERFLDSRKNFWTPNTIPMGEDKQQWDNNELTEAEKWLFKTNISYLTAGDNLVPDNIANAILPFISANEMRQYLRWQIAEESNHIESYLFILESFGLDEKGQGQIFELYQQLPDLKEKLNWNIEASLKVIELGNKDILDSYSIKQLLLNLVSYYCFEYIFFPCGFAQVFALARTGKLRNTAQQYSYIWRDENNHSTNALWLIKKIAAENYPIWNNILELEILDLIRYAVELEEKHAELIFPDNSIQGISKNEYILYCQYLANLACLNLGLSKIFHITEHPIPWISEYELTHEVNFFEGRVREYQIGAGLDWE